MALNLDTAIRLSAEVKGLNQFKALSERLLGVKTDSEAASGTFQQLAGESSRLAQESVKAASSAKIQGAALQDLQSKTRANAAETKRASGEARAFGGVLQQLRVQGSGVLDGFTASANRASNGIREFQRDLQPTDQQLAQVREQMLQVAGASKQTELSIKQQSEALKRLKNQAEIGGELYKQLTADIKGLGAAGKQLGPALEPGIRGLKMMAKASSDTTAQQVGQIVRLKGVIASAGEGYQALGRQIDALKQKAAGLDLSKGLNVTPGGVASGTASAIQNIVQMRRELSRSMVGRVVLTGEGLATAGVAGAAGAGVAAGVGGLAGGAQAVAGSLDAIATKAAALPGLLKPLGGLLSEPAAAAAAGVAQWSASLTAAQGKLAALSAPFEAIGTAISSIGPEASAAAGVASLAIAGVYQVLKRRADEAQADLERSFRGISDDAQKVLENLARIYDRVPNARLEAQQQLRDRNLQRLGEVPADSVEARRAANAVVSAEREINKIKGEQNQLIEDARQRENAASNELRAQVEIARQRLNAQRQLTAEVKKTAAERQQERAIAASIRRNQERVAAEQEGLRRRAAAAFPGTGILALPAAGQSSFQGVVSASGIGGGARARLQNFETAGTAAVVGAVMGTGTAGSGAAQAGTRARGELTELYLTIDRVTKASNGSITSLQRQRGAWEALKNAVNPAAPAYAKARAEVERLDQRLSKLTGTQENAARTGIGREALGSAVGSLAAGGGLQGAVGALAGGLAFSGGPAGIVAGGALSAGLGVGVLASRVGVEAETAEVRLRALTEQFGEYNEAQASAARISEALRISQVEASDGFSKLYAALRPTGITLQEVEDAFIGFTAAARASGATAEESSAALVQLKQALGSGILQGDELRSIREQAPAVGQAIAREMGVTIGELKKLGEQGKITTDVVIRALARLRNEKLGQLQAQFNTSAQAIKDLQVATQEFGLTVARVFGPATVALIRNVTSALEAANLTFGGLSGNQGAQQTIQDRLRARQQAERDTNARPFGLLDFGGRQAFFRQREEQLFRQFQQQRTTTPSGVSAIQQQARDAAAGEREAARRRAVGAAGATAGSTGSTRQVSAEDRIASRPFGRQIIAAARANGLDPALFAALVAQESNFNQRAVSRSGAIGLAQLMPGTARELGVNPYDPMQNLMGGARYLRQQISRFGLEGGLRAYNQGPGAQMRTPGGNSRESRQYPSRVLARYQQFAGGGEGLADLQVEGLQAQQQATEQIQQQLKAADAQNAGLKDQLAILQETDPVKRRILEYEKEQAEIIRQYGELKENAKSADEITLLTANETLASRIALVERERDLNAIYEERARLMMEITKQAAMPTVYNELETQEAALQAVLDKYPAIGAAADAAATLATRGVSEMIAGTKSAEEVFVEFLNSVADALLETAQRMIAQYIAIGIAKAFALGNTPGANFTPVDSLPSVGPINPDVSGSFGRALGGPTAAGQPYKVGENGPGLFVPYQAGRIIPAEATAAIEALNNASLRGLSVPFDRGNTSTRGGNLSVPFQRGMQGLAVPFQRGGDDASAGGSSSSAVIDVKFETVRIGEMDFVTRDEAERIGRESASRGAELAQRKLKNNPTARRAIGLS
jgi:tape measure domain-containing protein